MAEEVECDLMLDLGSDRSRAGVIGEEAPQVNTPSVIGRSKHAGVMVGMGTPDHFVGEEALSKGALLSIREVKSADGVQNWDDWEKMVHHLMYSGLGRAPEEHRVMYAESAFASKAHIEKKTQILMETFNVYGMYKCVDTTLSLFTTSVTEGMMIDLGHSRVRICVVKDGVTQMHCSIEYPSGGFAMDETLKSLIHANTEFKSGTDFNKFTLRRMKESLFASPSFDADAAISHYTAHSSTTADGTAVSAMGTLSDKETQTNEFELPDGRVISLSHSLLMQCVDVMFDHTLLPGYESPSKVIKSKLATTEHELEMKLKMDAGETIDEFSLAQSIRDCILKADADQRKSVLTNVYITGGCAKIAGLGQRLSKQLSGMMESKVEVRSVRDPGISAWKGGSILGSLSTFQERWMDKYEYDSAGPAIIHRKCA